MGVANISDFIWPIGLGYGLKQELSMSKGYYSEGSDIFAPTFCRVNTNTVPSTVRLRISYCASKKLKNSVLWRVLCQIK